MKKIIYVVLLLALLVTFTGCTKKEKVKEDIRDFKCGDLSMLELEREYLKENLKNTFEDGDVRYEKQINNIVSYDSLTDMLMALKAGKVDYFYSTEDVARYLSSLNEDITYIANELMPNKFSMATRGEDKELFNKLNDAINDLKEDGTLNSLKDKWMTNADYTKDIEAEEIKEIEGADTIVVAVTGDLPPMDYVSADGIPAGYNVALLSKLSEKLNMNIKVKQIEASSRILELTEKKVDVVFWINTTDGNKRADKENLLVTDSYFDTNIAYVTKVETADSLYKALSRVMSLELIPGSKKAISVRGLTPGQEDSDIY